jgi:hypothetical protein
VRIIQNHKRGIQAGLARPRLHLAASCRDERPRVRSEFIADGMYGVIKKKKLSKIIKKAERKEAKKASKKRKSRSTKSTGPMSL